MAAGFPQGARRAPPRASSWGDTLSATLPLAGTSGGSGRLEEETGFVVDLSKVEQPANGPRVGAQPFRVRGPFSGAWHQVLAGGSEPSARRNPYPPGDLLRFLAVAPAQSFLALFSHFTEGITESQSQPLSPLPEALGAWEAAPSVLGAEAGLWAPSAAGREARRRRGGGLSLEGGPLESSTPMGSLNRHLLSA